MKKILTYLTVMVCCVSCVTTQTKITDSKGVITEEKTTKPDIIAMTLVIPLFQQVFSIIAKPVKPPKAKIVQIQPTK